MIGFHLHVSRGMGRHFPAHLVQVLAQTLRLKLGTGNISDNRAEDETCEELTMQLDSNLSDKKISDWVSTDNGDPGYALLSDQDMIHQVTYPNAHPTEDKSEN